MDRPTKESFQAIQDITVKCGAKIEGMVKICLEILKAHSTGLEESLIYRRASKVSAFQYPNKRNEIVWCNVSVGY